MKKVFIILVMSILLIGLGSAYTTKVTQFGAEFLYTNESWQEFKMDVLTDFPECHNGKQNATYLNYTSSLDMNCHIWFNNTEDWVDFNYITLDFNLYSPLLNFSHPMMIQENNTKINLIDFTINLNGIQHISLGAGGRWASWVDWFGMPLDYHIGSCNPIAINGAGLNTNYNSNTTVFMKGTKISSKPYNEDGTFNDSMSMESRAFICDGVLNNTLWVNAQFSGLAYNFGGGLGGFTGSNSYVLLDGLISTRWMGNWAGSFTIDENSSNTIWRHENYDCFVPIGGFAKATFRDSKLECGNMLTFAFAGTSEISFIDSTSNTFVASGFLASWEILVKYTMKSEFKNKAGDLISATYNMTDSQGTSYTDTSTSMDEEVIVDTFAGGSFGSNKDHNPFNVNIQNDDYIGIEDFTIDITTNNKGFLPLVAIAHSLRLNPLSNYFLTP